MNKPCYQQKEDNAMKKDIEVTSTIEKRNVKYLSQFMQNSIYSLLQLVNE